jgi:two-component system cell cycle sensor histidine kinase/response regulator CckA
MQAIGQLAGGVAHDFNNLLTAISGHCDLLLLRHSEGDEDFADLMQITQNANRAAALVGQLLAFSRKKALQLAPVDLRETLGDLAHLLNRLVGEKVRLRLDHDPDLVPIRCDRRQLEQVLMNLVVNARDAMPDGGTIRIETRRRTLDAPVTRDRATIPPGPYIVVVVQDEGEGIPPDRLRRIFEPFFTTKRPGEGTGLGLSMAYGIVKQSGGFIFVESVPGEGATFELFFPAVLDPAPSAQDIPPAPPSSPSAMPVPIRVAPTLSSVGPGCHDPSSALISHAESGSKRLDATSVIGERFDDSACPPGSPGTVLLVEDEAPVRSFASRALKLKGYVVLEAASAEEALAMLEDDGLAIDLFVTDVIMPGLDGPSWVRKALKRRPSVPTVFMSGYSKDALIENDGSLPKAVFLPKPFSLAELTQTVEDALR